MRFPAPAWGAAAVAALLLVAPAAGAQPAVAEQLLKDFGFPADTIAEVKAGGMVHTDLPSSDERELAVGLAFLVTVPPKELVDEAFEGLLGKVDPDVESHGLLTGEGSLAELSAAELGGLADAYAAAKPGADLNLSTAEIQAFQGKPRAALDDALRQQLLGRYQAYHRAGLDGIAPYDRGGQQRSAAGDLRSATKSASALQGIAPDFYDTLLHYPAKPASGLRERYQWQLYKAHGAPVFILTHGFAVQEGDGFAVCQRQFYVSSGYNVEQAIAGFIPVPEGTLVLYVNRTSTDQVSGFGGGTKRAMGKKVMASQLEDLFAKFAKAADK